MKSFTRIASLSVLLFAPALVFAQGIGGGPQTVNTGYSFGFISAPSGFVAGYGQGLGGVAGTILYTINSILVPVLFAISFLFFLYGVAKAYIFSHGEPGEVGEGHKLILWGIIGFVAMVSLWGLVNVVANTFGLTGSNAPQLPTSY